MEEQKKKHSIGLLIATSIYGLLYAWFIAASFSTSGESWVSTTVPFEPFDLSGILVKLLFLLFLVGCLVVWKNELAGGVIFLLWWVAMWGMELFVVKVDGGGGILMGVPLFVLGILFVWRSYKTKKRRDDLPPTHVA